MWQSSRVGVWRMNRPTADILGALIGILLILSGLRCSAAEVLHPPLPGLEVLEKRIGETTLFSVRNSQLAEMTVSLDFTLDNLTASVRLPLELVVLPQSSTPTVVALYPTDPAKTCQYSYRNDFSWGTPKAQHASNQLYLLPFASGRSFRVVQGQGGAFSHQGDDPHHGQRRLEPRRIP